MERTERSSTVRTPARNHFTFTPHNKVYGVFQDFSGVRDLSEKLLALGLGDEKVEVLEGEDGRKCLDCDGRHHGLMSRFVRYLQSMTDERALVERLSRDLACGRLVVAVSLPGRTNIVPAVGRAFGEAGATGVSYQGLLVTEHFRA